MELLQLRYFCDTAVTENYSRTAEKHFVPVSSVCQSVKRLEQELSCKLFDHKGNRICLNENGKLFYAHASEALRLLDAGRAAVLDDQTPRGELRIVCQCNRSLVAKAISEYKKRYPQVRLILSHTLVDNARVDLLISDLCPFPFREKTLLVDEEIRLAMQKDHPLSDLERIPVECLKAEHFISMDDGGSLNRITNRICTEAGFTPDITIRTDDPFFVRKYTSLGLGIAFVPTVSWQGLFSEDLILKDVGNIRRKTYAFLPAEMPDKASANAFLSVIKGYTAI